STTFAEIVPINANSTEACLTQVQVEYTEEDPELYILPLAFASGDQAERVRKSSSSCVLAEVTTKQKSEERKGIIYDAIYDRSFCKSLADMIVRKRRLRGRHGDFATSSMRANRDSSQPGAAELDVSSVRAEQSNSSIVFGDQLILKLF